MPKQNNDAPAAAGGNHGSRCGTAVGPASDPSDEVAQLVKRATEKNAAFMRGDMDCWFGLVYLRQTSH
jgi:hypothetical protein